MHKILLVWGGLGLFFPGAWCSGSFMSCLGILLQPSFRSRGHRIMMPEHWLVHWQIQWCSWLSHSNQSPAPVFSAKHLYEIKKIIHSETYAQCCNSIKTSWKLYFHLQSHHTSLFGTCIRSLKCVRVDFVPFRQPKILSLPLTPFCCSAPLQPTAPVHCFLPLASGTAEPQSQTI